MDIFENLDKLNCETHNEFAVNDFGRVCDKCNKSVEIPFYISDNEFDLCESCYNSNLDDLATEIDRTGYSIEEKPRIWKCIFCQEKMGGGCKWYVIKTDGGYGGGIDICTKCYLNDFAEKFKSLFTLVSGDNLVCCMRTIPTVLDIGDSNRNLEILPEEIRNEITKERVDQWTNIIAEISHLKPNFSKFGSLKNWTLFTDITDIPHFDAMTGLIVDCSNSRVGSLLCDNHGRCGIDIIFNSCNEYLAAKREWENTKLNDTDAEFKRLDEKVVNDFKTIGSCDEDDLAAICREFSGYYRLKFRLGLYYG